MAHEVRRLGRILWLMGMMSVCLTGTESYTAEPEYEKMRERMVDTQLVHRGISDDRVLHQMRKVPRHRFVPTYLMPMAYSDGPLPIGERQTISQPYIVAFMTEAIEVETKDRVLEIGTGSGYQAAILSGLVDEVYTVEILERLYKTASKRFQEMGYQNIFTRLGDGWQGWPEEAPFDKIIVTAAADEVPQMLVEQLKEGGKMIFPLGNNQETQNLILGVKHHGHLETIKKIPVRFVPLVHGKESGS